jgi:hypothetical protein
MSQTYTAHAFYRLLVVICLALALAYGWSLYNDWRTDIVLFFVIMLSIGLSSLRASLTRLEVTANALILHRPLVAPQQVAFRQLSSISEDGRFNRVLTVLYHPLRADGRLVELDEVRVLHLPALNDQEALLTRLTANIPR